MDQRIRAILKAGVLAPSGDNCQPWRFDVQDDVVRIYNLPERDVSLYNYRQRASLVAHGALVENMVIAASSYGLKASVNLVPDPSDANLVAEVSFTDGAVKSDSLAEYISGRCTNRKLYRGGELIAAQKMELLSAANAFPEVTVRLFTGSQHKQLARVIGLNDRLVFENRALHSFLFDHIRWSDEEAEATRDGMDIKTLELAPPDSLVFPLLRHFELVRLLNLFGASRLIGANARKLALSAAAVGVISMQSAEPADYITCGRAMERVWLEATRQGLAFQLMTGISFLMKIATGVEDGRLAPYQIYILKNCHREAMHLLGDNTLEPIIFFRVGNGGNPTTRSLRFSLEQSIRQA